MSPVPRKCLGRFSRSHGCTRIKRGCCSTSLQPIIQSVSATTRVIRFIRARLFTLDEVQSAQKRAHRLRSSCTHIPSSTLEIETTVKSLSLTEPILLFVVSFSLPTTERSIASRLRTKRSGVRSKQHQTNWGELVFPNSGVIHEDRLLPFVSTTFRTMRVSLPIGKRK